MPQPQNSSKDAQTLEEFLDRASMKLILERRPPDPGKGGGPAYWVARLAPPSSLTEVFISRAKGEVNPAEVRDFEDQGVEKLKTRLFDNVKGLVARRSNDSGMFVLVPLGSRGYGPVKWA